MSVWVEGEYNGPVAEKYMKTPLADIFTYNDTWTEEMDAELLSRIPAPRDYSEQEIENQVVGAMLFDLAMEGQQMPENEIRDIVRRNT